MQIYFQPAFDYLAHYATEIDVANSICASRPSSLRCQHNYMFLEVAVLCIYYFIF